MSLIPKINKQHTFVQRECIRCGQTYGPENYSPSNSYFFDGYLPICNNCVNIFLEKSDFDWRAVDKICQYADIPFVPKEWERIKEMNEPTTAFSSYASIFQSDEYEGIGWDTYFQEFRRLEKENMLEDELPLLRDAKFEKLKEKWGFNYDDEALMYLERLYDGILSTQNVNGALQMDQALKICKMSYEIDSRIREGTDFDKILASYDKLVKAAEFIPKNVKNVNDFDTTGELIKWFEKKGWRAKFYDNVTRDIVDETIKNFQSFNQRLYINETGIGEEINARIESLKNARELEDNLYDTNKEYDLESFSDEGYEDLMLQDFKAEVDDD